MSPDTIALGVFSVGGTLLGALLGVVKASGTLGDYTAILISVSTEEEEIEVEEAAEEETSS